MFVLVDEAHGTHFYFNDDFIDVSDGGWREYKSVSMHKSGGSLTQKLFSTVRENVNVDYVMSGC